MWNLILILYGACFVGGIIFGTQLSIAWELSAVIVWLVIINIGPFEEMAGILPIFGMLFFVIGMVIGDISWAIQTDNIPGIGELINSIGNPFKVDN